jgi:hypothetical protein
VFGGPQLHVRQYKYGRPIERGVLYATRGLVETLLRLAREKEPDSTTIPLAVTHAADLPEVDLSDETPVFTHFYMPNKGDAVNAVFGVDLGTPVGQTPGVFVSHPRGDLKLSKRDEFREVVFVAVPPWEETSMRAFDRNGDRQELTVLDIEPPEETI